LQTTSDGAAIEECFVTEVSDKTVATTGEVIEVLREAMETDETERFIAQFAEDAVYETPFALEGQPSRLEGFETISKVLGADNPMKNLLEFEKVSVRVHPGADPELATAQFTIEGKVVASGAPFVLPSSVGIIRVRHGRVVHYTDYTNILRGAQIAGVLKQFAESLTQ
jgi:ketosteroid isomerase-like protein